MRKRGSELERSARQAALLEEVQKDINKYRERAVEEAATALKVNYVRLLQNMVIVVLQRVER